MSTKSLGRAVSASVVVCTALMFLLAGRDSFGQQAPAASGRDLSQYLPPGAGKTLVARECSTCHDLEGVIRLRQSKPGWEAVVIDMVGRGAPLMIEDVDAMTAYLAEVFGPKAPPLVDANTAGRDELMKLPGLTAAQADQLIALRAKKPFTSRDEVREAAGLSATAFEKLKWYVRAEQK